MEPALAQEGDCASRAGLTVEGVGEELVLVERPRTWGPMLVERREEGGGKVPAGRPRSLGRAKRGGGGSYPTGEGRDSGRGGHGASHYWDRAGGGGGALAILYLLLELPCWE